MARQGSRSLEVAVVPLRRRCAGAKSTERASEKGPTRRRARRATTSRGQWEARVGGDASRMHSASRFGASTGPQAQRFRQRKEGLREGGGKGKKRKERENWGGMITVRQAAQWWCAGARRGGDVPRRASKLRVAVDGTNPHKEGPPTTATAREKKGGLQPAR